MEFGNTIPLFFITICLLFLIVLGGTVLLLVIIFGNKDRKLTRNVLLTLAAVCGAWFLLPLVGLVYGAIAVCWYCPEENFHITWDIFLSTLGYSVRTLFISIPCGYVIAFGLVLPVTFLIRAFSRKEQSDPSP
jgi:hypothetical protein